MERLPLSYVVFSRGVTIAGLGHPMDVHADSLCTLEFLPVARVVAVTSSGPETWIPIEHVVSMRPAPAPAPLRDGDVPTLLGPERPGPLEVAARKAAADPSGASFVVPVVYPQPTETPRPKAGDTEIPARPIAAPRRRGGKATG